MFAQQTVTMRDGTQYSGRMTAATQSVVTFLDSNGVIRRLDVGQIDALRFNADSGFDGSGNSRNNRESYGTGQGGARAENFQNRDSNAAGRGYDNNNGGRSRNYITLPAGTELGVRTNEAINSSDTNDNRSYSAQVSRDVMDQSGNVTIPRGSEAQLVVRRISNNTLALDLQSVSVNGRRYNVDSADVTTEGNSRDGVGSNKRTAEYVGGGAVLGTVLGAIAGGGKGAAIGALAGGAAGAGTQVLTRGGQVKVPAESELSFRLDSPMTLRY